MINKKELKKEAWDLAKNNLSVFWLPYGFFLLITLAISELAGTLADKYNTCILSMSNECLLKKGDILTVPINIIGSLLTTFLAFGIYKIILGIIRKENTSFNDIFSYKEDWLKLFLLDFISSLFIELGFIFFIIPGIIIALAISMRSYIFVDKNMNIIELLKESNKMMEGYKKDYLMLQLSFVGWALLGILSFGILLIFICPYISFADALYYDELRKIKSI